MYCYTLALVTVFGRGTLSFILKTNNIQILECNKIILKN